MTRMRTAVATGAALAVLAGASLWVLNATGSGTSGAAAVADVTTGTADVVRTDIAERRSFTGTLGHSGSYSLIAGGPGTLTRLPAVGAVVGRGDAAYEVDGSPVVLFYGTRPAWRPFGTGMTDGADVRQLETGLRDLGHGTGLTVDRHFSAATARAVRRWQTAAHLPVTGTVPLGQIVFAPTAVRIAGYDVTVGEQVQPGAKVEHGTGEARAVTVPLEPAQLPTARVGAQVIVTMPDGSAKPGRISAVAAVAETATDTGVGGGGGPDGNGATTTVPVTVTMTGSVGGFLDQASVQVTITEQARTGVLAVPITALRAVTGGRYEVIVVTGGTSRHVPVEVGLFDETIGLAEVDGAGLAEGQKVEVPREGA